MVQPPQQRPNAAETAERDAKIFKLKRDGLTEREIAQHVGLSQPRVNEIIHAGIRDLVQPEVEALRKIASARLDDRRRVASGVILRRHYVVQNGKIVNGPDGQPLIDSGPVLAANAQLLKIDEREAKLFGLDPKEPLEIMLDARADLTVNAITAVIDRLQLPPDRKVFALESAAAILEGTEPPELPEPEQAPDDARVPWPMRSGGVDYVIVRGKRYILEGAHIPDDAEIVGETVDGEIVEDEPETVDAEGGILAEADRILNEDDDDDEPVDIVAQQQAGVWVSAPQPVRKALGRGAGPRRIIG